MTEKFKVLNDYTLQVSVDMSPKPHRPESYELTETAALRRIFNFRSAQVTTIMQQSAYIASDYSSEGGAGVTAASQMSVQNFDDIQSQLEIEFMHAQLKKWAATRLPWRIFAAALPKSLPLGATVRGKV